ncbi:MAG: hypothetical protein FD174_1685 [Geobacteraceae bacterium]|nr:MAG: hypothetical protein FD174_1685 [Geobacteraceae bacterium]
MHCPTCNTKIIYYFGKTVKGKQRFLCSSCGSEFTPEQSIERR